MAIGFASSVLLLDGFRAVQGVGAAAALAGGTAALAQEFEGAARARAFSMLGTAFSVSVVPASRAGMASGVFSTVRVAGEGLALAIVSATMAALVQAGSGADIHGSAAAALAEANFAQATKLLPHLPPMTLVSRYAAAFTTLCDMLAGVTACSAALVIAVLHGDDPGAGDPWDHKSLQGRLPR